MTENDPNPSSIFTSPSDAFAKAFAAEIAGVPDRTQLFANDLADEIEKCCDRVIFELLYPQPTSLEELISEHQAGDEEDYEPLDHIPPDASDFFFTGGRIDFSKLPEDFVLAIAGALTATERVALRDFYLCFDLQRLVPMVEALNTSIAIDIAGGRIFASDCES